MPYMYILECVDGSFYTGSTKDLPRRLWQHQNGLGANHTRKRSPNTRRTYSKGLKDFFVTMTQFEPTPDAIAWFLSLGRFQAIALVSGGSVGTGSDSCDGECSIVGDEAFPIDRVP